MNKYNVILDIKRLTFNDVSFVKNDTAKIGITVNDNGVPILFDESHIVIKRKDEILGMFVITGNEYQFGSEIDIAGDYECVVILKRGTEMVTSKPFNVRFTKEWLASVIEPVANTNVLQEIFNRTELVANEAKTLWLGYIAAGDTNLEVVNARGINVNLGDRLNEINTQMADFINKTSISLTHQFVDIIERDAYFGTNSTELVENIFIGVGAGYQQYLNSEWVEKSAILTHVEYLDMDNIKGTTQSIIFNDDSTVQKVLHKDDLDAVIREDIFIYTTDLITEIRTLNTGHTITLKYHLDNLVTEVI